MTVRRASSLSVAIACMFTLETLAGVHVVVPQPCKGPICHPPWKGSAVSFLTKNGATYLLTAAHNVENEEWVRVGWPPGSGYKDAAVVGRYELAGADIALLRVQEVLPGDLHRLGGVESETVTLAWLRTGDKALTKNTGSTLPSGHPCETYGTYDSEAGASGAPVVNAAMEIVGIHTGRAAWSGRNVARFTNLKGIRQLIANSGLDAAPMQPMSPSTDPISNNNDEETIAALRDGIRKREDDGRSELAAIQAQLKALIAKRSEPNPYRRHEPEPQADTPKTKPEPPKRDGGSPVAKAENAASDLLSHPMVQTAIVAASGGTGALGLAAVQTWLAWRRRKRNAAAEPKDKDVQRSGGDEPHGFLHDRDLTDARELVRLGKLEGRDPLLDSFMGMSFDDALQRDITAHEDDAVRDYARKLREEVIGRVNEAAPISTGKPYSDNWRVTK